MRRYKKILVESGTAPEAFGAASMTKAKPIHRSLPFTLGPARKTGMHHEHRIVWGTHSPVPAISSGGRSEDDLVRSFANPRRSRLLLAGQISISYRSPCPVLRAWGSGTVCANDLFAAVSSPSIPPSAFPLSV